VAAGLWALGSAAGAGPWIAATVLVAAAGGVAVLGLRARLLPTAYVTMGLGTAVGVVARVLGGGR
jgi:hypothetical protein